MSREAVGTRLLAGRALVLLVAAAALAASTLVGAVWPAGAGEKAVTKRARNDLREGPGSYYPLVLVLPAGRTVELVGEPGPWVRVRVPYPESRAESPKELEGWMSRNCFSEKEAGQARGLLEGAVFPAGSIEASPAGVAAAVRGFALRYMGATEEILAGLTAIEGPLFSPAQYEAFARETAVRGGVRPKFLPAPEETERFFRPYAPSLQEEAVGAALAARILRRGISQDKGRLTYVNLVAAFLAEQSGSYDYPFRVALLRGEDLYAMATPGGVLFLTEGLFNLCADESELAAVLAHEMMHVVLGHGVSEIRERSFHIKSDLAFRELEKEAGQSVRDDPARQGLEAFALDAYESIEKPRLQAYEVEADRGALLLLAAAGYDPQGLVRMVSKIRDALASGRVARAADNPFLQMDFADRAAEAARHIEARLAGVAGAVHEERFRKHAGRAP